MYKYGFWIVLLIAFVFFNMFQITKTKCKKRIILFKKSETKRITSLMNSNTILQRKVDLVSGVNIITGVKNENILIGKVLVILLSDFTCDRCQLNELKRLLRIEKELKTKGINIIEVTTQDKMDILIPQRKIIHIDFPLFFVSNDIFYNKLAFSNDFPQIIFVSNNIIMSAFKPVVKDDEFSEEYYTNLLSMIKE